MARILGVHGIAQQLEGEETLGRDWATWLRDGLRRADWPEEHLPAPADIKVAYYGALFRGRGHKGTAMGGARLPVEGLELQLLGALAEAARVEGAMLPGPQAPSKVWAPESAQRTLAALVRVPFFRRLTERVLIGNLRQVRLYLTDPDVRRAARRSLARQIGPDTRLIIGHSLGSVVAYEVLCIQPTDRQLDFVTLGSPLGLRTVIFDRLDPAPCHDRGAWPPCVRRWTNIADRHDLVAMVKELAPLFGGPTGNGLRAVIDLRVDNELRAHEVKPYLTARQTGYAVAAALTDGH